MSDTLNPTEIVLKAIGEVKEGQKDMAKKADIDAVKVEVKADIKVVADELDKVKEDVKAANEMASKMSIKSDEKRVSFGDAFKEAVKDNFDEIKAIGENKKRSASFGLKAVQDMTLATNAGGVGFINQQSSLVQLPNPRVNARDLISPISSDTGIYRLWREGAGEGTPAFVAPGSQKTQIDSDYTAETYTAQFLAAFMKVDRSMLQDLSFLQTALPSQLLRRFYLAENASFASTIASAAGASLSTSGTTYGEQLIDYVLGLQATAGSEYVANGIVINPADLGGLAKTKPSDYSLPAAITFTPTGGVQVLGVPVYTAAWVTAGNAFVADWSNINRLETSGLSVQFFEQDEDNVQYNRVTVRIECREVLVFQD